MMDKVFFASGTWRDKISMSSQLGGIESSVLDNGRGRGVRIAWFNTAAGLRFKVVLDRAMDIADAFYGDYSLAWLSAAGVAAPSRYPLKAFDWLSGFGGGLLTTCGLTHVGPPEDGLGLHDRISHIPAEIESIRQPDPLNGKFDMSICGRILQSTVFGPHIEMRRSISATLGKAEIRLKDEIRNLGNESVPHMLLYHCNLGWPLIDDATILACKGKISQPNSDENCNGGLKVSCLPPQASHNGKGESVIFIDADADADGMCRCQAKNERLGLILEIAFPKDRLPWLVNWQHWGKNEYVSALEPATNPPIGQNAARESGNLKYLEPNQLITYELTFNIL